MLDDKTKIYQRIETQPRAKQAKVTSAYLPLLHAPQAAKIPQLPKASKTGVSLQSLADELLLQKYSPAAVLVNNKGDILYISGRTGKYLEPAAGKVN